MLTKNYKKRKKLIKKLFKAYCKELNIYPIKLWVIDSYRYYGTNCSYKKRGDLQLRVTLDLKDINTYCKYGADDDYYDSRSDEVNPYILHNRHNTLRFALLHELNHAINLLNDNDYKTNNSLREREQRADKFALSKIK